MIRPTMPEDVQEGPSKRDISRVAQAAYHRDPAKVVIVVVNYNSAELVIQCVRSLQATTANTRCQAHVVIVDGGSTDDSYETLNAKLADLQFGLGTQLLKLGENGGFAFANNAAIRKFIESEEEQPSFFWLLNPDTIVQPGALEGLLETADQQPNAGIIGSKLLYADKRFQDSAFRFPSAWTELQSGLQFGWLDRILPGGLVPMQERTEPHRADWVSGASFLVRKSVIDSIGLLDDNFFLYFEEVEFCHRARNHGWHVWWTPESRVIHLVGQTSGVDTSGRNGDLRAHRRRPAYWFHSRARFFAKRYNMVGRCLADAAWLVGHGLLRFRTTLLCQPHRLEQNLISDFVRFTYFSEAAR